MEMLYAPIETREGGGGGGGHENIRILHSERPKFNSMEFWLL